MSNNIVRASIHPAIGIARLGSSPDEYLLAPQVPNPPPRAVNSSHDTSGRLKREAVEFRIYGYNESGDVVGELTADNAQITWSVEVANMKSSWFKFRNAMDVPTLADTVVERRNPKIVDPKERLALSILPGNRSIAGVNQGGSANYRFDTGTFKGNPVYLGEIRTTEQGRLLFLGGHGISHSPSGAPSYNGSDTDPFGNAEDWHDDAADGPVEAKVVFNGLEIPTEGAWVVSAPPSYAPDLKAWRSLYDVLIDLYVDKNLMPRKTKISFTNDIYPILARMSQLQWVNRAFAAVFGHNAPFDFRNKQLINHISQVHVGPGSDLFMALRMSIFRTFREQSPLAADPADWPWLYGDSYDGTAGTDPYRNLALGGERQRYLQEWSKGNFEADWGQLSPPPSTIDQYDVAEQPGALDRAALEYCAADAFHPGIELTWPMRHISVYSSPFRIARANEPEADFGTQLDVKTALGALGPLQGQFAGSLTRWMLVPWQVDTGGCLAGYEDRLEFDAPSFWPTRVPNHILSHENYLKVIDERLSPDQRLSAFAERRSWFATLGGPGVDWGASLIKEFGNMGVVEAYPGVAGNEGLPSVIYAETHPATKNKGETDGLAIPEDVSQLPEADLKARWAGFASEADRIAVRKMRFNH